MHNYWKLFTPISIVATVQASGAYAADYLSLREAQALSFPSAKEFVENTVSLTKEQVSKIEEASGINVRESTQKLWKALDNKQKFLGYFIIDQVYGKHEFITYSVAISASGNVERIEILDYRETYGGEINNPEWRKQFVGKKFGDSFTLDKDIKNISGATLSCKHVTDGVKRLLTTYEIVLRNQA